MIVKMRKVYCVSRDDDRDGLLDALGALGVMHLAPVDPAKAAATEQTLAAIDRLRRAIQILSNIAPAGDPADVSALEAAGQTLRIQRQAAERQSRLAVLHRQIEQLSMWGELELRQFEQLSQAGVNLRFYSVPEEFIHQVQAEFVQPLGRLPAKRRLVAAVSRGGQIDVPDEAREIPLPGRDRPSIRAEAANIDKALRADAKRLAQLAHLTGQMQGELRRLEREAEYTIASRSGLPVGALYALQGWVPAEKAERLSARLAEAGIDAAVQSFAPAEDEEPPTMIRYPRWARPIKGLFDILGTVPGYREFDVSGFFMIALPVFAAMLIGDAGYGLIFLFLPLLLYRRAVRAAGTPKVHLLIAIGLMTTIWGVLTANYFGLTPDKLTAAGGLWASVGGFTKAIAPLWNADPEATRFLLIKVSFIIGCAHLILAHVRQVVGYWPSAKALSQVGWSVVLVGMLGLVWMIFGFSTGRWLPWASPGLVGIGFVLVVFFSHPYKRLSKRIGIGLAASLLPLISTFGDTISYIRLMAVGLASYYIAVAFNGLGAMVAGTNPWLWVVGAPIVVFGHLLNIGLAAIAIFAHGVRLNMLEFSNNAGVQWAGYPYRPFAKSNNKES